MRGALALAALHQWMPVKYSSVDPASTKSAAIFRCCITVCTLAMRALCSCAAMGWALVVIELGRGARALAAATFALSAIAATAAVNPTKARLETVVMDSPRQIALGHVSNPFRSERDRLRLSLTGCAPIVTWVYRNRRWQALQASHDAPRSHCRGSWRRRWALHRARVTPLLAVPRESKFDTIGTEPLRRAVHGTVSV